MRNFVRGNSIPVPTLSNNSTLFRFETVQNTVSHHRIQERIKITAILNMSPCSVWHFITSEEHAASVSREELQASHSRSEWHGRFISSALKGITFYPTDRGSMFLSNVRKLTPDYTLSHIMNKYFPHSSMRTSVSQNKLNL